MYTLSVVHKPGASGLARRRLKTACKSQGLGHQSTTDAMDTAAALSDMAGVARVVVTWVHEAHVCTFRKGKRS